MSARRRLGGAALGFDEALARGDGEGAPSRIRVCCAPRFRPCALTGIAGASAGASHGESMGLEGVENPLGFSKLLISLVLLAGFDPAIRRFESFRPSQFFRARFSAFSLEKPNTCLLDRCGRSCWGLGPNPLDLACWCPRGAHFRGFQGAASASDAAAIFSTAMTRRAAGHGRLDLLEVIRLGSLDPGGIGFFHRRHAVAIFLRHEIPIVAQHEPPADV